MSSVPFEVPVIDHYGQVRQQTKIQSPSHKPLSLLYFVHHMLLKIQMQGNSCMYKTNDGSLVTLEKIATRGAARHCPPFSFKASESPFPSLYSKDSKGAFFLVYKKYRLSMQICSQLFGYLRLSLLELVRHFHQF